MRKQRRKRKNADREDLWNVPEAFLSALSRKWVGVDSEVFWGSAAKHCFVLSNIGGMVLVLGTVHIICKPPEGVSQMLTIVILLFFLDTTFP